MNYLKSIIALLFLVTISCKQEEPKTIENLNASEEAPLVSDQETNIVPKDTVVEKATPPKVDSTNTKQKTDTLTKPNPQKEIETDVSVETAPKTKENTPKTAEPTKAVKKEKDTKEKTDTKISKSSNCLYELIIDKATFYRKDNTGNLVKVKPFLIKGNRFYNPCYTKKTMPEFIEVTYENNGKKTYGFLKGNFHHFKKIN